MTTKRSYSYYANSGLNITGGKFESGLPSWRSSMTPFTWKSVPIGRTLAQVDPEADPAINPNYPSPAPWHGGAGQPAMLDAWCGFTANLVNGWLYIPIGGGHLDGAENSLYGIDMTLESPLWTLIHKPSGSIGMPTVTNFNDDSAKSSMYSDGRIRSYHTYHSICHVPGRGLFVSSVTGAYPGSNLDVFKCFWIDDTTGAHALAYDYSGLGVGVAGGEGTGGSVYDPANNCIWFIRNGPSQMLKYNLAANVVTGVGTNDTWIGATAKLVRVPGSQPVIVNLTGIAGGPGFALFDPAAGTWWRKPTVVGSIPSFLTTELGKGAAEWIPSLGKILLWNNDNQTTKFVTLTPPTSNPMSNSWTWGTLDADPSNTVTPLARYDGGSGVANTLSRMCYVASLKGFFYQRSYADPMIFYATE